jgi:hypothetical protein
VQTTFDVNNSISDIALNISPLLGYLRSINNRITCFTFTENISLKGEIG